MKIRKVIKIHSIAIRLVRRNGILLPKPELQLYAPYTPTKGWFIGCYNVPMKHYFNLRSMFKTVPAT